ncbi:HAMP domain-containing histidine kinase [Microbacterium sp. RG1]|nr:HAMP domain-containing histidine kinase [Microbacterium sp. RG1]
MTRPNLLFHITALPPWRRSTVVAAILLLGFVLASAFALGQAGEQPTSWWWPAAGAGAAAALSAAPRYVPLVILVASLLTATASALAGRPPLVVTASLVGTAAEIAVMVAGLTPKGAAPRLSTTRDVGRFILTAVAAAAALALVVAGAAAAAGGDFAARFVGTGASHLSALLLIVPLVLIDRSSQRPGPWWHAVTLTAAIALLVAVAFGPFASAPLSFLPVPLLAWAAFSQTMFVAIGQVLLAVSLASGLTLAGFGPFANAEGLLPTSTLLQVYAVAIAITCLVIATQRAERRELEDRQDAVLRLLRDAFARSRTGFLVTQVRESRRLRVLEANDVAAELFNGQLVHADGAWRVLDDTPLRRILGDAGDQERSHESDELGQDAVPARFWVDPIMRPELGRILLVTIEDLRPVRAVEQAMASQLDRERHVSEALRELNHKQDAFVASVSHELRTPITAIVGYAEELEDSVTDPDQKAYVEVISRNADRLATLVSNSLRAATITQPPVGVHGTRVVDLARIVTDSLEDLRYRIDERLLRVDSDVQGSLPVRANEAELGQIVTNLLTNAIKFSPEQGSIRVTAGPIGHAALVEIEDHGPGISEQDRARVFERFYRSPQAVSDGVPGSGIGLSVAQALAGAMGGAIVLSEGERGGTLATLRLPLSEEPLSER